MLKKFKHNLASEADWKLLFSIIRKNMSNSEVGSDEWVAQAASMSVYLETYFANKNA
jgi:hypothetical protein